MFQCDCCGLCCMNLKEAPFYSDLDRGDGICRFFDCSTRLCMIYNDRPDKCNIERSYQLYFKDHMTKQQYYQWNYEACEKLKEDAKRVFGSIEP